MRTLAVLLSVAALSLGAGGTGTGTGTGSASVRDVERAFLRSGQPFGAEVLPDPYLRPRPRIFTAPLPAATERRLERHVLAVLLAQDPATFSSLTVWVFDSAASAQLAQRLVPSLRGRAARTTRGGGTTTSYGFVVRRRNVLAEGTADRRPAVAKALGLLR